MLHRDSLGSVQHRAGRHQLDDGRPRHRSFGTHAAGLCATRTRCTACSCGSRCRGRRRKPSRLHPYAGGRDSRVDERGARVRLLVGEAFGPLAGGHVAATLYLDVAVPAGAPLTCWPAGAGEHAVYSWIDAPSRTWTARLVPPQTMAFLHSHRVQPLPSPSPQRARYVVIGGAPLDGTRFMWWKFTCRLRRLERIEQGQGRLARAAHVVGAGRGPSSFRCRRHALLRRNRCPRLSFRSLVACHFR